VTGRYGNTRKKINKWAKSGLANTLHLSIIGVISLHALENIRKLPFADQIKVFYSGFGMWRHNVSPI